MTEEKKTVSIYCDMPNGVTLQREEMFDGPLGIKTSRRIGEPVTLREGANEGVDAEFWDAWLAMHGADQLVTQGVVRVA
jgi:hypothetical protein